MDGSMWHVQSSALTSTLTGRTVRTCAFCMTNDHSKFDGRDLRGMDAIGAMTAVDRLMFMWGGCPVASISDSPSSSLAHRSRFPFLFLFSKTLAVGGCFLWPLIQESSRCLSSHRLFYSRSQWYQMKNPGQDYEVPTGYPEPVV
ncbi:hypothetical protein CRG98_002829 [Punica granatum]|uniref:Uncharacterized protein n=1 Tax=Punica granatum TaxID=22663 RepID=A0A2I0L887_PUNGR|nr:hypothetical protein CRG98_002829 [Punica granatum]